MALATVAAVLADCRTLLQDTTVPYRYSDDDLVLYLNIAVGEARRLRPDFFLGSSVSLLTDVTSGSNFDIDQQYRSAFVYYVVGRATLQNEEDTTDARAAVLLNKFVAQLTEIA